jgi:hypothetical protein
MVIIIYQVLSYFVKLRKKRKKINRIIVKIYVVTLPRKLYENYVVQIIQHMLKVCVININVNIKKLKVFTYRK